MDIPVQGPFLHVHARAFVHRQHAAMVTRELTRKEAQLLETKTSAMSSFYARSADLLVEMINDRTPGSEVYEDVINRLAPEPEDRVIRTKDEPADLPVKPKRKGILKKNKEQEAEE